MADPKGIFYKALSMFPNARIYANAYVQFITFCGFDDVC